MKSFFKRLFADKITLILMADLAGKMSRFSVPRNLVNLALFVLLVGATGFGYFSYNLLSLHLQTGELEELRQISLRQKRDIQHFALRIDEFQNQLARLEKFDKKLRVITALDTVTETTDKFGIGGPNENQFNTFKDSSDQYTATLLQQLNEDLRHFSEKARTQEISLHELDAFFKDQSSLLTSTPSIWPSKGWVTSGFGYRISPFTNLRELHEGIDIATHMNSVIIAPANGVVVEATRDAGFGNLIEIDHGYGVITRYGHNSINLVKRGDRVKRGQVIAKVGNTGRSTGPHLHYEVMLNGVPVNPFRYILTD
jgi:murein DD-endopeptidase MepM/ murein hydrolase activator NlpD